MNDLSIIKDVLVSSAPSFFAAILIILGLLRWREARKNTRFSAMPALVFDVKSGKTFYQKNTDQLSLAKRLFTKIFIKNDSKFVIYCFIDIILKIKYKDGSISPSNFKVRDKTDPLDIPVGRVLQFPQENLLSGPLLQKSCNNLNQEDKEKFELQKNEIKEISAEFIISAGPSIQRSFKFKQKSKWTFDLKEEVWLDPHHAKDYNISFLA